MGLAGGDGSKRCDERPRVRFAGSRRLPPAAHFDRRLLRLACLSMLFFAAACGEAPRSSESDPLAEAGVLDLQQWNWSRDGVMALNGDWEFQWRRFSRPGDSSGDSPGASASNASAPDAAWRTIAVPGSWTALRDAAGEALPAHGFGTYRLRVLLPPITNQGEAGRRLALRFPGVGVSYELYGNGRLLARRGVVAGDPVKFRAELYPAFVEFDRDDFGDRLEIIIHVSNYYHPWASGAGAPLLLGPAEKLRTQQQRALRLELILFGAILIMGLYHVALFAVRSRVRAPLYFGLFCLLVTVRLLVTGERILPSAFPGIAPPGDAFAFYTRLEYCSVYAAAPLFLLFARSLFPRYFPVSFVRSIAGLCFACAALSLVTPPLWFATYTMPPFQLVLLTGGALIFWAVGRSLFEEARRAPREPGAALFLAGWSILFLTVLHDILGSRKIIDSEFLLPVGLFSFILAQAALLATRFAGAFRRVEDLTGELALRNRELEAAAEARARQSRSFERFVPRDFLQLLAKRSVIDVAAGDATLRDMSVFFCDIRSFTTLSEGLGPRASFEFLNEYMKRMLPVIESHHGFVDKFLGDAILALFTNEGEGAGPGESGPGAGGMSSGDRALGAALEMQSRLRLFNHEREDSDVPAIRIGIGINTGEMMLGTVGSENRLDTTVIGNAVNMASRLESLTNFYGCSILISDFTRKTLVVHEDVLMREVGSILLKGRLEPTGVYEVYAADSPEEVELKERTKSTMFMGIVEFKNRDFRRASDLFAEVLAFDPADRIARVYLQRSEELMFAPPDESWQGVFEMYVK